MTMTEIEKIIEGHYHSAARQDNILKMWEIINNQYEIKFNEYGTIRYIVISDKAHTQIISTINKTTINLKIYNNNKYHTQIISHKEWESLEAKRKATIKRQQEQRENKKHNSNLPYGIYCIKYKDEIIYIGMTQTSFEQRWREHKQHFTNPANTDMLLYHSNLNLNELEFCVMVDLTKEKANRELTTRDIKAMEMGLIACFKPRFNVSGVKIPYRFD